MAATTGMILCPVDHPIVSAALVAQLIEQFDSSGKAIVLPTYKGRRGHPVIFRASLYQNCSQRPPKSARGKSSGRTRTTCCEVPTEEEGVILNMNDPETLERALGTSGQP